jgi:hypothetical protein
MGVALPGPGDSVGAYINSCCLQFTFDRVNYCRLSAMIIEVYLTH